MIFSSKEIETQIERYNLTFLGIRDPDVEWKLKLPMFVDTFYRLIQENHKVPTQNEFVKKYFELNQENLKEIAGINRLKLGVEGRLRRTYPSLVRDLHLDALLRENGLEVAYDRDTDVIAGIDHVVKYKGALFMVHSFVGTFRGRLGRSIKNSRHNFEGKHVDIILDLSDPKTKKIGDFFVYSINEVERLKQEMDKLITT